jgi:hypothetical protein
LKVVRGVGKNQVHRFFWQGVEDVNAVALQDTVEVGESHAENYTFQPTLVAG